MYNSRFNIKLLKLILLSKNLRRFFKSEIVTTINLNLDYYRYIQKSNALIPIYTYGLELYCIKFKIRKVLNKDGKRSNSMIFYDIASSKMRLLRIIIQQMTEFNEYITKTYFFFIIFIQICFKYSFVNQEFAKANTQGVYCHNKFHFYEMNREEFCILNAFSLFIMFFSFPFVRNFI